MDGILAPGVALMRRLKYGPKFYLLGAVFLCFTYFGALVIMDHQSQIATLERELNGLRYFEPVRDLLQQLQQHRGMSAGLLSGNESFRPKIATLETEISGTVAKVDQLDQELGDPLRTAATWRSLKSQWTQVNAGYAKMTSSQSTAAHNEVVTQLIDFLDEIADSSELILDPKIDSYHLISTITNLLPPLSEHLGQARAIGTAAITKGKIGTDDQIQLVMRVGSATASLHSLETAIKSVFNENAPVKTRLEKPFTQMQDSTNRYLKQLEQIGQSEFRLAADPQGNASIAATYFNQASEAIGDLFKLSEAIEAELHGLLLERSDGLRDEMRLQIGLMTFITILVLYLFMSFYRVVIGSVQGMDRFAAQLAEGNLAVTLEDPAQDELGHAAVSFNKSVIALNNLMRELRGSAGTLTSSAHSLASVTTQTRSNMQRQQGETDQVASAMEELTATAEHIAVSATEAALAAGQANQEADDGRRVVEQTIGIIHALANDVESTAGVVQKVSEDSNSINVVLDVIRDIAEQTNLLALNAAIEAARAGEQGRGFAVVADEVRTLASRTQQSTQKIRDSIEQLQAGTQSAVNAMTASRNQARSCVEQAESARRSLDSIAASVSRINDMNAQIGSATEEQSQTVASVTHNITSVTQLGFETVNGASEASSLGQQLTELATRLEQQVGRFKV